MDTTIPGDTSDMPELSPVARALSSDDAPPEPAPAAAAASPVARLLQDDSADVARLSVAQQAAGKTTPDQAARVLRLEMQTGLPSEFIAQDVDGIEKVAADRSFSAAEFRKSSPKFAGWLASNPNHYAFAKEDLGFFGRVEKMHQAFSDGVASVPVQEELAGLINQEMDGTLPLGGTERIASLDKIMSDQQRRGSADDKLAYGARQMGYSGRQFVSTIAASVKGAAAGGIGGAAYGSIAPGLGTLAGFSGGVTAGGLSASWLYSYNMERAFAYKELRATPDIDGNPMDAKTARAVATGVGVINAFIEIGSEYVLAKMVPGLSGLIGAGKSGVTQQVKAALIKPTVRGAMIAGLTKIGEAGATEGLEEVAQAYTGAIGREIGQASSDQIFPPDSAAQDFKGALSQGTDAFVGTALTFGAGVGGSHFILQLREARIAERAQQFALALGEGAESTAFKNLPEKAQEAVRSIIKDGPLKTAHIDTEVWQQYWQKQNLDPREVAAEVMGDATQYDEAVKAGHELAVPMDAYARKIAVVPEANKFFAQEIRYAPGAMNARESRELFQKIEQEHADFMKAEDEFKATPGPTPAESAAAVKADVVKQLKAAGVDDKAARTQAELMSGFESLGQRAGIDPMQLYKRYNLKVRSEGQLAMEPPAAPAKETFMQRAKRVVQKALGVAPEAKPQPGWQVKKFDNTGLSDPQDGFRTPKYEYRVYMPGKDVASEVFSSKKAALYFIKQRGGSTEAISSLPYEPYAGLAPEQRGVEQALATSLAQPDAADKYAALPNTKAGKLLNVDEARFLAPEYAADKAGRTRHTFSTQRPSAAFIAQRFQELLAEPAQGPVLFMAGGGGSGKTTVSIALLGDTVADSDIILDSVFASLEKSVARIEAALATGREVKIAYVHREITEAAQAVADRFALEGRFVPAAVLTSDHINAQETFLALAQRYSEDARVELLAFENKTGQEPAEISLDELAQRRYTNSGETAVEAEQRLLPEVAKPLRYVEQQAAEEGNQPRRDAGQEQAAQQADQAGRVVGAEQGSEDGPAGDELTLAQDAGEVARARIRLGADRQVNIDLLKKANLSSFVHELWHFYFEVMADLSDELGKLPAAERTSGQQGIIDDYAALLAHVGAKDRAAVTDAMHEQIARSGEAYLMRGVAPSGTLRRAFARFRVWMTHIYKDIKALAVNLTPEVTKVFDRLLATDEAISQVEAEQNVSPLFSDPAKLLGEKDAKRYLEAVAAARTEAEEELSAKVLDEVKREQEAWWKEERAKTRAEVESEVNDQPVYKALMTLQNSDPNAPSLKMDPDIIDSMWHLSDDARKKLPRGITSKDSGVSPFVVAEMFGFKTGVELLDALAAADPRVDVIERMTDQRMVDAHGDLAQETGRLHDAALEAVHNKKRSELLHRELEILADKHMPQFKGLAFKMARRPPTVAAIRSMAEGMIGGKTIKEINPVVYQRAEKRASTQAIEAMLKGDFDTAFEAKQREFLNHELFRAATNAREDVDKALERFKKIAQRDEDLAKTRDIDLVNAARAVLSSFGIGKKTKEGAVSYLTQMSRYDPDMHETIKALIEQAAGVGSYEEATYDDFVYLKDTVDALWDLSKRTKQIMIDGKLIDRQQVMSELANRIVEIDGHGQRAGYSRAVSTWEKTKIGLMGIRSALRRVESWVDAMDSGDRNGVFRRYIWTPVAEATAAYRVDRRTYLERYLEIVKAVEKSMTSAEIMAPELGYTFADKAELLGAVLHSGNDSNLSKLLRGRGWGAEDATGQLDRSRWDRFITRAQSDGTLTKADYEYAQAVWDLLEELKPRAQKAHKEMYGYYFGEVSARGFETPFGQYRGGYVPAVADTFMAADAAIRSEREQLERSNNSYMFPTTGRGFTKGRVERYAAPLMMDVRFIPGHIDKVLRFLHIEPRVKDIARIVMDRDFRKTLDGFDQTVGGDMLVPWLQRSAQQRIDMPMQGYGGRAADTFFRALRSRVGLNVMFANVANTLQQPFDISRSFVKVDAHFMRSALWSFVRAPAAMAEAIASKSEFMSTRETAKVMEVQRAIDDMMLNPSRYEEARKFAAQHGYFMQSAMQNQVDTITWSAAYDKATAEGAGEKEAVRFADSVVRETQGSMAAEDVSRFETGTPFARAFTMFYGYFNMQANLLGTEFATVARDIGLKKGAGRLLYAYTFGFAIPAIMGDAIVKSLSGDKWDQDDDGYLDDIIAFFFAAQARNATAMFPFVGPAIMAGANAWNNKWYDDRIATSPAVSAIESSVSAPHSVYQALHDKAQGKKAIRDSMTLLGLLSGLPLAPLARPLGYLADVNAGKAQPTGPVDYARGLISGKAGKR